MHTIENKKRVFDVKKYIVYVIKSECPWGLISKMVFLCVTMKIKVVFHACTNGKGCRKQAVGHVDVAGHVCWSMRWICGEQITLTISRGEGTRSNFGSVSDEKTPH